jgi:hypothetical protein
MTAHLNGSGRSRRGIDTNSFLALNHAIFGSNVDPWYYVYSNSYESRGGLKLKVLIVLVQGVNPDYS